MKQAHLYNFQNTQIAIAPTDDIRKVYVELTSECNFTCKMCLRHSFSIPTGVMTDEVFARVQTEITTLPRLKEVVLGGLGEPLFYPRLQEIISWIKHRNLLLTITTNGALLEDCMDDIIVRGVDRIVISFETGEFGHSNGAKLFDTIKKLCRLKSQKNRMIPALVLSMVITKENIQDLPEIAAYFRDIDVQVDNVFLSNLLPATQDQQDFVLYPFPEAEEIKIFQQQLLREAGIYCRIPNFEIITERFCEFINQHAVVIRRDGEVAPCYRFLYPRTEIVLRTIKDLPACSFGNIQETPLLDIWNGRKYTWLRFVVHNSLYPSCLDCVFREGCGYLETQEMDCWGNEYFCADCLWARGIVKCL